MKNSFLIGFVVTILLMLPVFATGETILTSAPLKGGQNGTICSCINVASKPIEFYISISSTSGGGSSITFNGNSGFIYTYSWWQTGPSTCRVIRKDGKNVSAKKFKCTIASVDSSDDPLAVLPVNIKIDKYW